MLSTEQAENSDQQAATDAKDDKKGAATDANANPEAAAALTDASKVSDPFSDLAATDSSDSDDSGETGTYTVKRGDTLMKVAFSLYGDIDRWKDIYDLNKAALKKASHLKVGMKLHYEAPAQAFQVSQLDHSYLIKQGDTLAGIADDVYGRRSKYHKLQNYNKNLIKNPNRIFAGFTIYYDITAKEMAEAEARRKERTAGGTSSAPTADNSSGTPDSLIPSAVSPPQEAAPPPPAPVAEAPTPPPAQQQPLPPPPSGVVPAPASTGAN
jgi:hypothetical protein